MPSSHTILKAKTKFSLKDHLFNKESVGYASDLLKSAHPKFDKAGFCSTVLAAFPSLELKQRISHMSETLGEFLPADYPRAVEILVRALPPELDPNKTDDDFGEFILAPFSDYVAQRGCREEHLDLSLNALREMTKRFSAENAIRFFINEFPKQTMAFLFDCAGDANYHVRRLASEGTRPKLPWAQKLVIDFREPIPILEKLHADNTRYVTRSVANHVNDISKQDPQRAIDLIRTWKLEGLQQQEEMDYIARHSLRTLTKQGSLHALKVLGCPANPKIDKFRLTRLGATVRVGEAFEFSCEFTSGGKQDLLVDYVMYFATEGKKKGGQKTFQLKQLSTTKNQEIRIRKKHPMKLMTTRRLYEGKHRVVVRINGKEFGETWFTLRA